MLIGITGYAQHGKDTVANLLVRKDGFVRRAFADTLRSMVRTLDPYVVHDPFETAAGPYDKRPAIRELEPVRYAWLVDELGYEGAKQNPEVRRLLQVFGTEVIRDHLGPDVWVDALDRWWREQPQAHLVVPDVRFPNEAEYIQKHGELWSVERVNDDGTEFDNGIAKDHPSEAHILDLRRQARYHIIASTVEQLEVSACLAIERTKV